MKGERQQARYACMRSTRSDGKLLRCGLERQTALVGGCIDVRYMMAMQRKIRRKENFTIKRGNEISPTYCKMC